MPRRTSPIPFLCLLLCLLVVATTSRPLLPKLGVGLAKNQPGRVSSTDSAEIRIKQKSPNSRDVLSTSTRGGAATRGGSSVAVKTMSANQMKAFK